MGEIYLHFSCYSLGGVELNKYILFAELLKKIEISEKGNSKSKVSIMTLNPHSFMISIKNEEFRKALIRSDILICDGIGVLLAGRITGSNVSRLTGMDHFLKIARHINHDETVLFIGSTVKVLEKIQQNFYSDFGMNVLSYSPPFRESVDPSFVMTVQQRIDEVKPNHIFLGLTAPKQEILADKLTYGESVKSVSCVGAVFDFYAGNIVRAPVWMQQLGLEWLFRVCKEPRRMMGRLKTSLILFPMFIFKYILRMKLMGEGKFPHY